MKPRRGKRQPGHADVVHPGRRSILAALVAGVGATLAPRRSWAEHNAGRLLASLRRDGIPFVGDQAAAAKVGRRYLSANPDEADVHRLTEQLGLAEPTSHDDARRIRSRFDDLRRAEFGRGQTVLLDGWILAQSEARLCALIALHQAAS